MANPCGSGRSLDARIVPEREGRMTKAGDARAHEIETGPLGPRSVNSIPAILLDLGFAELDVLARDRVILLLDQLLGHGARVLLGDVKLAGVGPQPDLALDDPRFGHCLKPFDNLFGLRPSARDLGQGARQTGRV